MKSAFYPDLLFNVVLIEPEIPTNTGNIGRTCVGTWSRLHLVGPLGFSIDDKQVKRAGLDYWEHLDIQIHLDKSRWIKSLPNNSRVHYIETGGSKTIYDLEFQKGDHLVFGRETSGIPKDLLQGKESQTYSIPFPGKIRSFNLSNCVAMVIGEGLRQLGQSLGPGFKTIK